MNSRIYEFAIVYNPTEKEREDGAKAEILIQPQTVLAASEDQAGILAARAIPEGYLDKLENVEVAVRPF